MRVMMIGGWTDVYRKATARGFHLTVAQDREAVLPADIGVVDRLVTYPINDPVLVDLAETLHRAEPFDAAVSFQEHGLLNAALIAERLGIFGNPPAPVLLTRDKVRMREHLQGVGLAPVPHCDSPSITDIMAFGRQVGWPIIVKPREGSGSRQVSRVDGPAGVAEAVAEVLAVYPTLIAEAFVVGPEVSVEALSWAGEHRVLAVTEKLTSGAPHYVETGHTVPARLPAGILDRIGKFTVAFLDAIGHRYGPSHTEVIAAAAGPVIVESHTRTGGDRIFEMVELVTGIDMFGATLSGFAGNFRWPEPGSGTAGGAAIRFFDFGAGMVTGYSGVGDAERSPGVVRVDNQLAAGKDLRELRMTDDRPGYLLATGRDASEAATRAEAALARIRVTLA
jgi:biotin carboxylase